MGKAQHGTEKKEEVEKNDTCDGMDPSQIHVESVLESKRVGKGAPTRLGSSTLTREEI